MTRRRRRRLVLVLGLAAAVVPGALASAATVNASAVISGSGLSYSLAVTNTGTDPIQCVSVAFPPGTQAIGVAGPSGAVGGISAGGAGFAFQQVNLAPAGSATFSFSTAAPYPAQAGADLRVSADCRSDVAVRAVGPAPACDCLAISTRVAKTGLNVIGARRFQFQLNATMRCSKGTGQCAGEVDLVPPRGFRLTTPATTVVSCSGPCDGQSSQTIAVAGKVPSTFRTAKQRRGKTVVFGFKTYCVQTRGRVAAGNEAMTIVYTANGRRPDARKSDLNGDGLPDGPRRRK